jgi:hypothetical protein
MLASLDPTRSEVLAMRDDRDLLDLPEAVPLYRVSPWWRLVAIFGFFGMALLLAVTAVIWLALMHKASVNTAGMVPPRPVPPPAPMVIGRVRAYTPPSADSGEHPFPVKADLAEVESLTPRADESAPALRARNAARQRFLNKGQVMWQCSDPAPDYLTVSRDGQSMAYIVASRLMAGPVGSPQSVDDSSNITTMAGGVIYVTPTPVTPGSMGITAGGPAFHWLVDVPAWVNSESPPRVYCADAAGRFRIVTIDAGAAPAVDPGAAPTTENFIAAFHGEFPASGGGPGRVLFVRSHPTAKMRLPNVPGQHDATEVVLGNQRTQQARVLISASPSSWRYPALSPDGKLLAVVSNRGHEEEKPSWWRVFLVELGKNEPRPISPPADEVGPLCWTPDSKALLYSRSQSPPPADVWEEELPRPQGLLDLFQWDLAANRETRLSRGGGFFSPTVTSDGQVFYLMRSRQASGVLSYLCKMPLTTARTFAAKEPEPVLRDVRAWTELMEGDFKEVPLPANPDGEMLTAQRITQLSRTFNRLYKERFKTAPPGTVAEFERQRRELASFFWPNAVPPRLGVLLGAQEGEYLVRHHGAQWKLTRGPVVRTGVLKEAESPFGLAVNPFQSANDWLTTALGKDHKPPEDTSTGPATWLKQAQGRPLILANDPASARAAVAALADPDLERGTKLLKENKGEEAEAVLLAMLKKPRHAANRYLVLQVAAQFYEHRRLSALHQLMEKECEQPHPDAQRFNLLGLALLDENPQKAIDAFKNALRCDLSFGPGYLNLADAYRKALNRDAARECLQRYLELDANGPYAADAQRRLARLESGSDE